MGGTAVWYRTCISLWTFATWLTIISGQRNPELERQIQVRLAGGRSEREGIVELTYDGRTGKLCDTGITSGDVAVLCRMLGYEADGDRLLTNSQELDLFPQGSSLVNYILYRLDCSRATDFTIADCSFEPGVEWFVTRNCVSRASDVGIQCLGEEITPVPPPGPVPTPAPPPATVPTICSTPSVNVRLTGGNSELEGRVEVRTPDGRFGGICDDRWGLADAQVICRMLCYDPRFSQARINLFGESDVPFYLTNVDCVGTESDILDCTETVATTDSCELREVAGVSCFEQTPVISAPPTPVVECINNRITARFSRALEPRLRVEYVSLANDIAPDCGYTESIDNNFVTISIPFVGCGTSKGQTNSTHITYSNTVRHAIPPLSDIITRTTVYNIQVTCVMRRDTFTEQNLVPEQRPAPPVGGTGSFRVNMQIFRSNTFTTAVQAFPVRVTLGDFLYVGLGLNTEDRNLKLIVPECKATPDPDRNSEPQYYFIDQKCRVEDSVTFYAFNETFFAFRFQSFKFVGDRPFVYIHCTSYVCTDDEDDQDCDRSCELPDFSRGKRSVDSSLASGKKRRRRTITRTLYDSDRGPIEFLDGAGNLIQLERELQKPRPIAVGSSGRRSACVTLTTLLCLAGHLFQ